MDEEKIKLKKLQEEQKAKSQKEELLNSYIESSKNLEDKIAVVKLKHRVDKTAFVSSLKNLMKKK
tara:strand:+ start:231 stop:425 length:195 start_codon:yes stop_codon:yes gene_type:complete